MYRILISFLALIICGGQLQAQVKVGNNVNLIDSASILELESTDKGFLTVRMTTAQRDSIATPPIGLQIYNLTTNTLDIYSDSVWSSMAIKSPANNYVYVYSLDDLPTPSGGAITLNANKMYIFSGIINISPNYLNLNGANLRGIDPARDGVMSTVSGAVLRSTGVSVFMEDLAVIPASGSTMAYDLQDASGNMFCNLFSGCSVVEIGIPTLGVGQVSGFRAITITKNYWKCQDGIKVTGNVGKFASTFNFITEMNGGTGIEFMSGLTIDDIDLANNYFIYTGGTGVKVNAGSTIDLGRMSTNMFRGVGTLLSGFDSYTPGWEMLSNTDIPNTRSYGYLYMIENTAPTATTPNNTYVKIAGTTTATTLQKFTSPASNRLTYIGKRMITGKVFITTSAKSPTNNSDFTIALAKNGTVINAPRQTSGTLVNNQGFSFTLEFEVPLTTNDYLEVYIKTTSSSPSLTVSDLQFRVVD